MTPAAPAAARKSPGRDLVARKPPPEQAQAQAQAEHHGRVKGMDIGPAEIRLHAEHAQAVARLHAEHAQQVAKLLLSTIEHRSADLEHPASGGAKTAPQLCGSCCGPEHDPRAFFSGGVDSQAVHKRRTEMTRLNSSHVQALAKQEERHARQMTLLQVETDRKDMGDLQKGRPAHGHSPVLGSPISTSPGSQAAPLTKGRAHHQTSSSGGTFACCGRGQRHKEELMG